ncbi:iron complex transport system permease protein [Quadrisphaera granulorum]|uniref:Iron complex transport system permease protein n=1 Tax=Quadrisphaera granulorum TaxID=317664 RepID=A0A316AA05_9ACTN|nr:iron chelate uptake ABC transporter family permease subunit [Quadrisphaera granulorum]PWJ54352.1 iron complex transport system permease protein [Quadrisphaera granulorum]SZE96124.1 iron complex transport system permease protein [Quadrisphaera granulorum]
MQFPGLVRPVRLGPFSHLVSARAVTVVAALGVAAAVVVVASLALGRYTVPPLEVVQALTGRAEGMAATVVREWRLPRVIAALGFGAALGCAGAAFQSLTRNPLGSPDVIGFSTGAHTGALVAIVFLGGAFSTTAFAAILGGALTAVVVYLAARQGSTTGFGIILVGVAVTAVLSAVNSWILRTADLKAALTAAFWGLGSLNGVQWERVTPALVLLAVPFALVVLVWRSATLLEMGDDAARSMGVRAERTRVVLIVCGVLLTAVVTAVAGPIAFVALAAPQIAAKLTGTPGVEPLTAAATGAFLLAASDLIGQHAFGGTLVLPVGVVTASLGGAYLVWLVVREARRRPAS